MKPKPKPRAPKFSALQKARNALKIVVAKNEEITRDLASLGREGLAQRREIRQLKTLLDQRALNTERERAILQRELKTRMDEIAALKAELKIFHDAEESPLLIQMPESPERPDNCTVGDDP